MRFHSIDHDHVSVPPNSRHNISVEEQLVWAYAFRGALDLLGGMTTGASLSRVIMCIADLYGGRLESRVGYTGTGGRYDLLLILYLCSQATPPERSTDFTRWRLENQNLSPWEKFQIQIQSIIYILGWVFFFVCKSIFVVRSGFL